MEITKKNYEAFFLDYHEGNLAPEQVAELLLFIEQHPELREEFESFENFSIDELPSVSFENKSILKKEITAENRDEYFIRAIEQKLNATEQQLLDAFLNQHPQYISDLALFRKTKLQAGPSVVFEDKEVLKDISLQNDYVLIAAAEGLLSLQEHNMLMQQLQVDAEMQQSYSLYQQTKLTADTSVLFKDKDALKRKERKVIPLFYYIAAAAAIVLLFGIFTLFKQPEGKLQPSMANNGTSKLPKTEQSVTPNTVNTNSLASAPTPANVNVTEPLKHSNASTHPSQKATQTPVINEAPQTNAVAQSNEHKETAPAIQQNNVIPVLPKTQEQQAIAQAQPEKQNTVKPESKKDDRYLSLGEIAAEKIKQRTFDTDALAAEKKTGKINRFSGWDALQVVAKGISKLTGRDVNVKPTYNDQGEVTAYAFNAGKVGFSKER